MKKEKVLITGGAGYLGSILVPELLKEGYNVTVVDNLMYKQVCLVECFMNEEFDFVRGDASDPDLMIPLLKDKDIIIPLAAIVGAPACSLYPQQTKLINYDAVRIILENVHKEQKIVFPSTNSCYGVVESGYCDENTPLTPISLYGKLKVKIERELLDTNQTVAFRLATVFGASPRMRADLLVNDFTYRAMYDRFITLFEEHFKRNFIHIRDVTSAFLFAIKNFDKMVGETYNIGLSDTNLTKRELCEKIREFVPEFYIHTAPVGEDIDKRNYVVSSEKIESLGWKPKHSLSDGIKELVKAYKLLKVTQFSNV